MLNEKLRNDLLLVLEHIEQALFYFSEVKAPDDFVSSKQGHAYYDAILMRLQVTGELLKKSYTGNENMLSRIQKSPGMKLYVCVI